MTVSGIRKDFRAARQAQSPGGKRMTQAELSKACANMKKGHLTRKEKQAFSDEWFTQTVGVGSGIQVPEPKAAPGATSAAARLFGQLQRELDLPPPSQLLLA